MADYSPTIIAASLNDKELEASIKSLVSTVKTQTETMAGYMDTAVARMKASIKSLGNISVDMGGSADGGSSRRAKKQVDEKQAVDATGMSYDKLLGALQMAEREARKWEGHKTFSTEDLNKYQAALARVVELNEKLRQEQGKEAYRKAEDLSRLTAFDAKANVGSLFATDARLTQLNKFYSKLESEDQKRIAREERDSQKRIALTEKEHAAREKMIQAQRKEEEKYQNSILRSELGKTLKQPAQSFDEIQGKLERLKTLLANIRDLGFLTPKEITSAETEITKLTQKVEQFREALQRVRENEQRQNALDATVTRQQKATVGVSGESLGWGDVNQQAINSRRILAAEQIAQATRKEKEEYSNLELTIASLIGVKASELNITSSLDSTYSALSSSLRKMSSAYDEMNKKERDSAKGQELANAIQETSKAINDIQKQKMRPISLDKIIGFEPKTLDDIAYKIQMLQRYRSGIDITKPNASKELDSVNKAISELNKKQRELLGTNKTLLESNNALARSWNYMKNRLAFYFTVGASTAFVKNLIEVRSQYEMNERALGILVDSAARGTRIFNELSQMSLVSPYTLIELSTAAKQLTAYDIAAKDVVDTTRRLADMAAAVGAPVERLTYALGQIKAYGYLNSRDARMFANAGIPLVKQLAEYYTELEGKLVSAADVYDRMKKKAIDFNAVMAVVNKMTDEGGKFFDFQAKMADTLKVRLANLTLAWNNMLNAIGKDTNGILTTSIKGLAELFKHWRSVSRILGTVVTALGAYKAATWLAAITTSTSIGKSSVAAWLSLASSVRSAKDATALFSLTIKSIPFVGWVTAIASLVSWFYLFNQSGDEVKQKLQDIQSAFDGVRKEVDDLFADAIRTDSIGTQLTKLQSMLETAETELGIVIPINLEDVNESNIKQKLKEARNFIDTYLNFSQTFSEAAAGSNFNKVMNEFGANARTVYTSISESINTVVVALQELTDKGEASKRDIEILNELTAGQKEDESRIEYLQRLVRLYEELGLIGKKEYTPNLGISAIWRTYNTNMEDLQAQQEKNIERLGIKNKSVFESMLNDVQGYYSSSQGALSQFEKQIERVAQKIDINSIPVEQRTLRLQVAINEEASLNNWNEFEKEYARQIANQKYGTQIEISSDSKKNAKEDLQDWQKRQQEWMDNHGIKVKLSFQIDETEESYASRMLQAAKDAKNKLEIQRRKLSVGTGSQEDVDKAIKDLNEAIERARAAGADLSQLDKGGSKKDILGDALTKELQLITDIQKLYKEYTKAGVDSETAKNAAAKEYQKTLEQTNKTLSKFGVKGLTGEQLATMDLRAMRDYYQSILDKVQSSPKAVEALEKAIRNLNVEITKEGQKTIIDSLNSELSKLKDEYELAVELDANPELGENFATLFGINPDALPHDIEEYADRALTFLNNYLKEGKQNLELPSLNLTPDDIKILSQLVKEGKLGADYFNTIKQVFDIYQNGIKKTAQDLNKFFEDYVSKYGTLADKIKNIENEKNDALEKLNLLYNTEALRQTEEYYKKRQQIIDDARRKQVKAEYEEFRTSEDYERFFTAIDTLTKVDALNIKQTAKQHLIEMLKVGELKASQFRKEVKALEDQFDKLAESKTNFQSYLSGGFDALIKKAKETAQEIEIIGQKIRATGKIDPRDAAYLDSFGKKFLDKDGIKSTFSDVTKSFGNDMQGLGNAVSKAGMGMQGAASNFAGAVAIVDTIVKNIHGTVQGVMAIIDELNQGRNEESKIESTFLTAFSRFDQHASAGWENLKSGNIGGAITETAGSIISIFTTFASAANERINKRIKQSERHVQRLEISLKRLSAAASEAYGTMSYAEDVSINAMKKLQLEQLKYQLQLEESRKSKYRDEDRIIAIRGEIEDLKNEIYDLDKEWFTDFLGVSSAGDAVESVISRMIDAFRRGEDYMFEFKESFEDMIDNMIVKSIASSIIGDQINTLLERIKERGKQRANPYKEEIETLTRMVEAQESFVEQSQKELEQAGDAEEYNVKLSNLQYNKEELARLNQELNRLKKQYTQALSITPEDLNLFQEDITNLANILPDTLKSYLDALGIKYGDRAGEKELSALQQGIQSLSEDTGNAIESYLNGISQQIYLHSSQLEEIKAIMQGWDFDVSLGTMSQILLQLQSSYQVQMTIQNTLLGWSSPNGMSVRVEMV